jgi:hypothetical protein
MYMCVCALAGASKTMYVCVCGCNITSLSAGLFVCFLLAFSLRETRSSGKGTLLFVFPFV